MAESKNPQLDKFKQAAREHGVDEDEARWEERLKKVAKAKPGEAGVILIAVLMAKLLDPIAIALSIANGFFSRSMVVLIAVSFGIAALVEVLLSATQVTRTFDPASLFVGFIAALAWSWLVFWIRRKRPAA